MDEVVGRGGLPDILVVHLLFDGVALKASFETMGAKGTQTYSGCYKYVENIARAKCHQCISTSSWGSKRRRIQNW